MCRCYNIELQFNDGYFVMFGSLHRQWMLLNKTFLAQDKLQAVGGLAPHASLEHQSRLKFDFIPIKTKS